MAPLYSGLKELANDHGKQRPNKQTPRRTSGTELRSHRRAEGVCRIRRGIQTTEVGDGCGRRRVGTGKRSRQGDALDARDLA